MTATITRSWRRSRKASARGSALALVTSLALGLGMLGAAPASAAPAGEAAINSYAKKLGSRLGAPTGDFATVAKYGKTVTYRSYAKGFLAHNGSSVKLVAGQMLKDYNANGGVRGELGAPVIARWCTKSGSACLQRFQKGSIYRSASAPQKLSISLSAGEKSELIAVARSQVGYKEPKYRKNKYGKFVNGGRYSNNAWCSFFPSWVSANSGNGIAIPKRNSFPRFVKAVKKRDKLTKKAAVGHLAFTDYFRDGHASHVGIVVAVHDNYVTTIEGNIDKNGNAGHPRGVFQVNRAKKDIVYYAKPNL